MALKDNIALAGVPMMNGSVLLEGYTPEFDASVVTRMLDAGEGNHKISYCVKRLSACTPLQTSICAVTGATIVGKTACEHLCYGGNSFTSNTGPVLNPHGVTRSAGGSSSGSAALVGLQPSQGQKSKNFCEGMKNCKL